MSRGKYMVISNVVMKKIFDGDFDTRLVRAGFIERPREVFTVKEVEQYARRKELEGVWE